MNSPIRVLHIVPTFYPATYFGGPIHSLLGLCDGLAGTGRVMLRVLTTDSSGPRWADRLAVDRFPVQRREGFDIFYCRKWWGREFSGTLLMRLYPMIRWAEVVHLTSVYSFSTPPVLFLCRLLRKPVVWSPRGQLQRWHGSRRPLLKYLWQIACNVMLDPRRCILHATGQNEADESVGRITRAATEIVANGVEIPPTVPERPWQPSGTLRLLYIGRLDPKKGIENLLRALKKLDDRVNLRVCGTGDSVYVNTLHRLAEELGLSARVVFAGHVDGAEKHRAFLNSDICIVPSYTENFAMVVAEALAHAVPVIASRGTPWSGLVPHDCGAWVENDPDSLVRAILDMRARNLVRMGMNGRRWMQEDFSWAAVSRRMLAIYARLARAGAAGA